MRERGENQPTYQERHWGFHSPTVLIESQSAPVLLGDEVEQSYMRAFVLAGRQDLVVTDFTLNRTYTEKYLGETLEFELPTFMVVPDLGGECLSDNIIKNPKAKNAIRKWANENGVKPHLQFFSVTEREKELASQLEIQSSSGDLGETIEVGSKPGFRRFCDEAGLPIPDGRICSTSEETSVAVGELLEKFNSVLIKSENGTGGNDLISNIAITKEEYSSLSSKEKGELVDTKLSFFGDILGNEWVVEEIITGEEASVHVFIHDDKKSEEPFVLGALSENSSYVGGYWPLEITKETRDMMNHIKHIAVPELQKRGVYGYHCFDFKDGRFLEDNARQGALDFVDGMVGRIASTHFPGQQYSYWHYHAAFNRPLHFDKVWEAFGDELNPKNAKDGNFMVVTNPEVLPHGRSLDLTAVSFGNGNNIGKAAEYFNYAREKLLEKV